MLMEKELKYLKGAVNSPVRPMACIVGGAKVSSKVRAAWTNSSGRLVAQELLKTLQAILQDCALLAEDTHGGSSVPLRAAPRVVPGCHFPPL